MQRMSLLHQLGLLLPWLTGTQITQALKPQTLSSRACECSVRTCTKITDKGTRLSTLKERCSRQSFLAAKKWSMAKLGQFLSSSAYNSNCHCHRTAFVDRGIFLWWARSLQHSWHPPRRVHRVVFVDFKNHLFRADLGFFTPHIQPIWRLVMASFFCET